MTDEDVQEQIDEVGEAGEDVSTWRIGLANGYLLTLFLVLAGALVASVYFDIIEPSVTITATVDVGWLLEYLIAGLVGSFLIFTFAMLLVALPGSLISAVGSLAYGIASSQGYINEDEE